MPSDNSLTDTEITKFCTILALLAPDKPREAAATGDAAMRSLATHGHTWRDLLVKALPKPEASPVLDDWPRWRAAVQASQHAPVALSAWDSRFLATLADYEHQPSDRQLDVLATIVGNVLAAGGVP